MWRCEAKKKFLGFGNKANMRLSKSKKAKAHHEKQQNGFKWCGRCKKSKEKKPDALKARIQN